jgi:hypothetical protein
MGVEWDGLTRKPCVIVIGVTSNNVGLSRAKEVLAVCAGGHLLALFLGNVV